MPTHQRVMDAFSCESELKAVAAGATVAALGLDTVFIGAGLGPQVHWALAGYLSDVYCLGGVQTDVTKAAMCAAGGWVGGMAAVALLGAMR